MKYIYVLVIMVFMGCSEKSAKVEVPKQSKVEVVEVPNVSNIVETKVEIKKEQLRANETMVEEKKVIKNIASDVPSSCAMWSDGSNICTRVANRKASCTTNPVENRMFSCLQWQ